MFATSMTLLFCVDMMCNCIFVCHVDVNNKWPHITSTMQTCIDVASHFALAFFYDGNETFFA